MADFVDSLVVVMTTLETLQTSSVENMSVHTRLIKACRVNHSFVRQTLSIGL